MVESREREEEGEPRSENREEDSAERATWATLERPSMRDCARHSGY